MKAILLLTLVLTGQRNIFKYVEDPPRRPKPKPAAAVVAPVVVPQMPVVEPVLGCGGPPVPFQFALRYVGSFGPEGNLIGVLVGDHDVLTVRAGDVLVDGLVVQEVATEWIAVTRGDVTNRVALAQ